MEVLKENKKLYHQLGILGCTEETVPRRSWTGFFNHVSTFLSLHFLCGYF